MTDWQNRTLVPMVRRMLTAFPTHLRLSILLPPLLRFSMTQVLHRKLDIL